MININYLMNKHKCGYYCLKYIFKKYKKNKKYLLKKDMIPLKEVENMLKRAGFSTVCFKEDNISNIYPKMFLTLLEVKNGLHYVLVLNYNNLYVYYYDPLYLFIRKIKKDKFNKKWSNINLHFLFK